jgi:hypothetical protein
MSVADSSRRMGHYASLADSLVLPEQLKLDDVVKMTPLEMAQRSALVMRCHQTLVNQALSLRNPVYRQLMIECLLHPKITFLEMYPARADREALRDRLAEHGFMLREDDVDELFPPHHLDPQPYLTAPSSHFDFYNAHPGGLAMTVAVNCRMAEYHTAAYQDHFGIPADRDLCVAALCIHEYPKVWLYYWKPDGSWGEEPRTIDQDTWHAHDIYVTSELMHRGAPPELIMAVAAAHQLSLLDASMDGKRVVCNWRGPSQVVKFLHASALLANRDPLQDGLLVEGRDGYQLAPQPCEIWVTHLADMNWPYTMGGAHLHVQPLLETYASEDFGLRSTDSLEFNQFRSYIWSQVGQIPLYEVLVRDGREAVRTLLQRLIRR